MMKRQWLVTPFLFLFFAGQLPALAQGCVAIRPMSCSGPSQQNDQGLLHAGQWEVTTSYRYFESFRHFRGSEEETNRIDQGTQVINTAHSLDLGIGKSITDRFSLSVTLPIISYDRSSLYEHYGNSLSRNPNQLRFHTDSFGLGDMRVTSRYWLLNPATAKGNINLGLGLKLPTGDENVQGEFHRRTEDGGDTTIVKAVDQSIQLGDGGWGGSLEIQSYLNFNTRTSGYFSGFYLFNPSNTNDTLSRGTSEGVNPIIVNHSVADQYAARLGVNTLLLPRHGLQASLGGRIEGVPSEDTIGGSNGYRRPGYVVSAEPALTYDLGHVNVTLSVPIALYRNRVRSVYDKSDPTGQRHGDAAFADYLINLNLGYRFDKNPFKIFQKRSI